MFENAGKRMCPGKKMALFDSQKRLVENLHSIELKFFHPYVANALLVCIFASIKAKLHNKSNNKSLGGKELKQICYQRCDIAQY